MSATETTPDAVDAENRPGWQEYPIGVGGELATAIARTLIPFAVGVGGAFLLCLAIGITAEEELLPVDALNVAFDQLARYAMLPVMALGWTAGLVACVTLGVRDVLTSRAVLRAARSGAATAVVPNPVQVERVTEPPFGAYHGWTVVHVAVLGLLVIIGFFVALADPEPEAFAIVGIAAGVAGLFAGVDWLIHRFVRPGHEARRRAIAKHWTPAAEGAAWQRARTVSAVVANTRRLRGGALVTHLATVVLVLAAVWLSGLLFLTHPQAQRFPGGSAGPRAELSDDLERVVDVATGVFVALIVTGLVLAVLGAIVEGIGHAVDRRRLRTDLADPSAASPAADLLQRYAERHTPRPAQAAAALGGASLCLGWAGVALGALPVAEFAAVYRNANDIFADLLPIFLTVVAAGALLVVLAFVATAITGASGRDLRNALNRRWPVRPAVSQDRKNPPPKARIGPALSKQPRNRSRRPRQR